MRWQPHSIVLYAFDLLHLNGKDLRQKTLLERRAKLRRLVGAGAETRIQFSEEFDGDGDALLKPALSRRLRASCRSMYWHRIGVAAARLG